MAVYDEPKNTPGIAIVANETEQTATGSRTFQTWHRVSDGKDDGTRDAVDVAISTTTWVAFSSLVASGILSVTRFAVIMGVASSTVYWAYIVLYLILFGLWLWMGARVSTDLLWLRIVAVIAGFIFGVV